MWQHLAPGAWRIAGIGPRGGAGQCSGRCGCRRAIDAVGLSGYAEDGAALGDVQIVSRRVDVAVDAGALHRTA